MGQMFFGANSFNADISKWDTTDFGNMYQMFSGARSFNQDLSRWDVSNKQGQPPEFRNNTPGWTGIDPITGLYWCNKGQPQWGTDGRECLNSCASADWSTVESSTGNINAFQCTVGGQKHEYADFHVLNATAGTTNACSRLPTPDANPVSYTHLTLPTICSV